MRLSLALSFLGAFSLIGGACRETDNKRIHASATKGEVSKDALEENEAFELTAAECSYPEKLNRITVSSSGSLFINDPVVVSSERAKTGVWSFGFLLREIMELPVPGYDPAKLKLEQDKVMQFLDQFTNTNPINTVFKAEARPDTRMALINAWGKTKGTDNIDYLTFDKAPFKLVGITNRMDISKVTRVPFTAGEGRFIFGFTGAGRMTVILEYNLPIAAASPVGRTAAQWVMEWYRLKSFLDDTNPAKPGVQPAQGIGPLALKRPEAYLSALQALTDKFTLRISRKSFVDAETWVPLSQMRTNEFIQFPWELREIRRLRPYGTTVLELTTVKNNPDKSFARGEKGFSTWIENNVTCSNPNDRNSCSYTNAIANLPATIPFNGGKEPLLAASAPVEFGWFPGSNVKHRFVALNTCSGCHESETGTNFVHISEVNGAPSRFLVEDVKRRLVNFKALVCKSAASDGELFLGTSDNVQDAIFSSSLTH